MFYSIQYKNGCLAAFDLFHMFTQSIKFYTFNYHVLKETRSSYFCLTPKNHRLMLVSWKKLKSTVTKKKVIVFLKLWWRKLLKVAAFVTFPLSIMVFFEIHQRFKGHFLNKLRISFKSNRCLKNVIHQIDSKNEWLFLSGSLRQNLRWFLS